MSFSAIENQLSDLVQRRDALKIGLENTLLAAQRAGRNQLLPSEERATDDVRILNERINELGAELARAGGPGLTDLQKRIANQESRPAMQRNVSDFHLTYRKGDNSTSWFRDLMRHTLNMDDTGESRNRLFRHAEEVSQDVAYAEYRDLNRTDGTGGYA